MSAEQQHNPPRWAQRLLEWYCKPELLEDLQGDLNEYFDRHVKSKGPKRARVIYIIDVFKFFRLYTVRKPKFFNLLIQWIMIGSYIKTSGRSILRNKLFSAINIFGLAVSMSVGLLLIGLLSDMSAYDKFHEKGNRIYRVISKYQYLDHEDENFYASTSPLAGKEIKETIPGIEAVTLFNSGLESDVKAGEKTVPLEGLWANESMFNVFSFPLIAGNQDSALKNPFSVVLTESAARKLFGDGEALGQTVRIFVDELEFTVTGIVKDVPKFSHLKFEMLGSISTREILEKNQWPSEMAWDNIWNGYTYLLLPDDADLTNIQNNLNALCEKNDKTVKNTKIKLALQPLHSIALGDDLNNSIGPVMSTGEVWMIGVLSVIVILSACFNYTNLSIARALRRSREVGIRKVIGALRGHVLTQFIVEAILISLLSLVLSFVLFMLLKPYFLTLQPKMQEMLNLNLSPEVILYFLAFAVGVGLLAGFTPAFLFSKINAIQVLKDTSSLRLFKHLNLRKALIVLQYTISLAFIASTIIGFKQYKYLLSFDLGYNTENILNIELIALQGNKADLLIKELKEMPEVEAVSQSLIVTSTGNHWGTQMKYIDPLDSASVHYNGIDENYIPLHDIKLMVGRNFTPKPDSVEESEVIVNEEVLKRFNIGKGDPLKALDEILTVDRKKMKIIGVVKDFHYGKADRGSSEVVLRYFKGRARYLNVKISTTDWLGTLAKIESAWKKLDNVHPLEAQLYSDRIAYSYREISAVLKMMGFLAFLAICIASLGLLGMVIFITETRLKEISIRKVLGANEGKLIYLLSKGFLILLIISGAIALPITYLFFDQLVFQEMQNHINIVITDLLIGFFAVMILALILIGSQTLKIARTNPAHVLKNE
jgi:ABC-type antimicrobial peptide transport system permease subunit